jgi:hypothetical protein
MGDEIVETMIDGRVLASDGRVYELFDRGELSESLRFLHSQHPLERSEPDKKGRISLVLRGTGITLFPKPEEVADIDRFLAAIAVE